tara:strand:- start:194 stop:811 length:618 start_codon:yes stop_codon:yes gene_type:complete
MVVKYPFGPPILEDEITDEFRQILLSACSQAIKNPSNIGGELAGNIEDQLELPVDPRQFIEHINPYIEYYLQETLAMDGVTKKHLKKLCFNLGGGPWVNFQRKHEFNPVHIHSGELSCVIMIDVPEVIAKEKSPKSNMPCPGRLEFIHGTDGYNYQAGYKVKPKTAQIYLFPSTLRHTVYPFTSDVERITMSFNVYDIQYEEELL